MVRQYFGVHRETMGGDGAFPYVVTALAMRQEATAGGQE
jgi:hypothetical protein